MLHETPYSNPIAPQWMYPDWGYREYCETEFTYTFGSAGASTDSPLTIPAAGLFGHPLQFSRDAEFHIVDWKVWGVDTAQATVNTGLEVRLVDAAGKHRINNFVPVLQACGFVAKSWVVPAGGVQRLDVKNTTGGAVTVFITFRGFKRYQHLGCPVPPANAQPVPYVPLWARYSSAPDGWVDEPYIYEFPVWDVTAPFAGPIDGISLPMDTDAPFLLRSVGLVSPLVAESDTNWSARLATAQGNRLVLQINPYSQALPYATGVGFGGIELVPVKGRYVYPELYCPAGSVLSLDVYVSTTTNDSTGTLYLSGVKRQRKG